MNKEALIQQSNDTFFDNDTGEITAAGHRAFNEALIEAIPDPGIATALLAGLVKSTTANLGVAVAAGGTMSVNGLADALDKKQGTIPLMTITNFDTFKPDTSMTVGSSCFFKSTNATGKPDIAATASTWVGFITRINTTEYRILAMSNSGVGTSPQMATRHYYVSGANVFPSQWQFSCEELNMSQPGFVKFPSGLLLQWGVVTTPSSTGMSTIIFPLSFTTIYSANLQQSYDGATARLAYIRTLSESQMTIKAQFWNNGSWANSANPIYWIAIGTWK